MAGMPTNQRDQVMLAVGILGIVGAAAYWYFVYSPKTIELDTLRAHVEKLDESNQRAKVILARGSVQQLQEESKRLQSNLDLMRTLIPTGNEIPSLLEQISGAARRAGLEFSNFAPTATVQGETFETQRFRMSMQGNFHEIGTLFASIGSLRRIVVPVNVSLAGTNVREARGGTSPEERMLTASFDIQTYVVRAAPAAPAGGKP